MVRDLEIRAQERMTGVTGIETFFGFIDRRRIVYIGFFCSKECGVIAGVRLIGA